MHHRSSDGLEQPKSINVRKKQYNNKDKDTFSLLKKLQEILHWIFFSVLKDLKEHN